MRFAISIAALLLATSVAAAPVITSIEPPSGSVTGGTTVIVRGTGFSDNCITCSPPFATPEVYFGLTPAVSVKMIDSTRLEVVSPPHLPGMVPVTVRQFDGSEPFTRQQGFGFLGQATDAFDPILFPIFTPPVRGAFGSEFHTRARLWNHNGFNTVTVYGIDTTCTLIEPPIDPLYPFPLQSYGPEFDPRPACSSSVGHLFWVPKDTSNQVSASLRVTDVTRQAASHGVEIPLVRRKDFFTERFSLLEVPVDARYRNTLRIYSLAPSKAVVTILDRGITVAQEFVELKEGANVFQPSTATFTAFPAPSAGGPQSVTVVIEPVAPCPICPLPHTFVPTWAFVTVTNNETQHITTITPN